MARCDFHMHSNRSDGRFEPEEVVSRAVRGGLELIALTDHDVVDAFPAGEHVFDGRRVTVLAGVEVSASIDGAEQHLLVYFGQVIPEDFREFLRNQCALRAVRWEEAGVALGLDLPPAGAASRAGERALTRFHLAQRLVAAGRARTVGEAFAHWIGDRHGVVSCPFPPMIQAIARARAAGGVPVWAHPQRVALDRHLPALAAAGLAGLEGLRPGLNATERQGCRKAAKRHGLVVTGGSDWHGWSESIDLGLWSVDHREIEPFLAAVA